MVLQPSTAGCTRLNWLSGAASGATWSCSAASDRFTDEDWAVIRGFLSERGPSLDLDSLTDRRADLYLETLRSRDADRPTWMFWTEALYVDRLGLTRSLHARLL